MDIQDTNIVKKHHVEEFAQELAFVPWLHLPSNVLDYLQPSVQGLSAAHLRKKEGGKLTSRSLICSLSGTMHQRAKFD
jgi:hypothetical protein